jgi:hypothetical protein
MKAFVFLLPFLQKIRAQVGTTPYNFDILCNPTVLKFFFACFLFWQEICSRIDKELIYQILVAYMILLI